MAEWYVNGPLGIEQGFTVGRAISRRNAGMLRLRVEIDGNVRAVGAPGARSAYFLDDSGRIVMRDSGLEAVDARGRVLPSWLQASGKALVIRVDTAGAAYPVRVDPLLQQGEKLTGSEATTTRSFGASVALSADGDTALVGAPQADEDAGAAWVFVRNGSTWTQQGSKLTGTGEIPETGFGNFGMRVALSDDGNTALISAGNDNDFMGAMWVFVRSGATWTQQGNKLAVSQENGQGSCGMGLALSGNGDTALVGCPNENAYFGGAWVFVRSGSTWVQQGGRLTGAGEEGRAYFGSSVALSADGNTAAVGGWNDASGLGAAWVFARSGSLWTQEGLKLTGASEEGAGHLGESVSLAGNGATLLAGGPADADLVGAAWAFARNGSEWASQGAKMVPTDVTPLAYFGSAIALSYGGDHAIISGTNDEEVGAAWEFRHTTQGWMQAGTKLTGGEESGDAMFGSSVALSCAAGVALIGGQSDNDLTGAAWPFAESALRVDTCTLPNASRGMPYSFQLVGSGGTPPYKWKKITPLPKGLKLNSTGLISGSPKTRVTPGSYTIEVQVKDKQRQTANTTLGLTIS